MRPIQVVALSILLASAGPLRAEDTDTKGMLAMIEAMGLKESMDVRPGTCRITVDVNQTKTLENVSLLQKFGVLNEDKSRSELSRQPVKTTTAIALQFAPTQIKAVYQSNGDADRCQFTHYLIANDEYGNSKREMMFAYQFDRATYNKINWDNFVSTNLHKVSRNFEFGTSLMRRATEE